MCPFFSKSNVVLPEFGRYATGIIYVDNINHEKCEKKFEDLAQELGLKVIHWRTVPVDTSAIGNIFFIFMH